MSSTLRCCSSSRAIDSLTVLSPCTLSALSVHSTPFECIFRAFSAPWSKLLLLPSNNSSLMVAASACRVVSATRANVPLLPPHRLDEVWSLCARQNLRHNHRLAVNVPHGDIRNDQRLATIRNGIRDGIHNGEHLIVRHTHHAQCLVLDAEHDAPALAIGKCHRGFFVYLILRSGKAILYSTFLDSPWNMMSTRISHIFVCYRRYAINILISTALLSA